MKDELDKMSDTSTEENPIHTYTTTSSDYTIILTAYSLDGTEYDTHTKTIEVKALPTVLLIRLQLYIQTIL